MDCNNSGSSFFDLSCINKIFSWIFCLVYNSLIFDFIIRFGCIYYEGIKQIKFDSYIRRQSNHRKQYIFRLLNTIQIKYCNLCVSRICYDNFSIQLRYNSYQYSHNKNSSIICILNILDSFSSSHILWFHFPLLNILALCFGLFIFNRSPY